MSRYFLTKLRVEGFRGVNNEGAPLELRFAVDKVNSIYADNGYGKSSLYDALSYAIFDKVPKLAELERSEDSNAYYNNRFHSQRQATIGLTFTADDDGSETEITVSRDQNGVRSAMSPTEADPEAFLVGLRNDFVLLDQSIFEGFIRESSQNRGRCFTRLLGLSRLSDYHDALKKLAHEGNLKSDLKTDLLALQKQTLESDRDRLVGLLRVAYDNLTGRQYTGEIDPTKFASDILLSLQGIATIKQHCEVATLGEVDLAACLKEIKEQEGGEQRKQLADLQAGEKRLTDLVPADVEAEQVEKLRQLVDDRATAIEQTRGPLLLSNYRSALSVLESQQWDDPLLCPTCEKTQDKSLLDELQAKLKAYETVDQYTRDIKQTWNASVWSTRWRKLDASSDLEIPQEEQPVTSSGRREQQADLDDRETFTTCSQFFSQGSLTFEQFNEAVTASDALEQRRSDLLIQMQSEIARLEESLPQSLVTVSTRVNQAKQVKGDLAKYEELLPKLATCVRKFDRRISWAVFIKDALRDFAAAEAGWVEARQKAIATDCQAMHQAITVNPDVVPNFERPNNSERLYLRLEQFYGLTGLSANTLLQESYCNSLAISTFLSTALLYDSPARFIVLDDVTSSFDGGHQFHLMELLQNSISPPSNPDGLQVILLTHDTLLKKYLDKASNAGRWRHHRLTGQPPTGHIFTVQHDLNRIRQRAVDFLSTGQTEEAGPWLRQYLESILSKIIRKSGIRVPVDYSMSDHKQVVQDSLNAIQIDIQLHQHANTLILTTQQQNDSLNTLLPHMLSNMMAHFQTGAFAGINARVLQNVLDDVDKLADCFKYDCQCRQSGTTVRRFYRSMSQKDCNC